MATWMERHGLAYALLRLEDEPRPSWARAIGLRGCLINGEEMPLPRPRFHFQRRLGSFIAHPRANTPYQARQEAHFDRHLRELRRKDRQEP